MTDRVTPAELRKLTGGARSNKYGAKRSYVAELDRWFHSGREANAAVELLRRQQAGEVRGLRFQVRYSLDVAGLHVCDYIADFVYDEWTAGGDPSHPWSAWLTVVADSKGFATREYRIKRALMRAVHGVVIREL